ncbi:MAG: sporulation protein YqfC [Clostridiales bacterium]|nr:sporulation protein YqfC [Clostridiales bacterium]
MRNKKIVDVKSKMSEAFELPKEITLDLPKISLIGNIQCLIENHRGIIEYSKERIRVNSSMGVIRIDGEDMNLRNIASDDIIIIGHIESIEFI